MNPSVKIYPGIPTGAVTDYRNLKEGDKLYAVHGVYNKSYTGEERDFSYVEKVKAPARPSDNTGAMFVPTMLVNTKSGGVEIPDDCFFVADFNMDPDRKRYNSNFMFYDMNDALNYHHEVQKAWQDNPDLIAEEMNDRVAMDYYMG